MNAKTASVEDSVVGSDDYAVTRVPEDKRYSWFNVATQRFGQLSALAQFFLAATIGVGMSFWDAILAITIGSVLLEIVTIFVGIAGMKEGLSTSVLARWTGFGAKGSALVGLAMAVSLTGWFGVQNEVFAQGLTSITGMPFWVACLVGGIGVTLIVAYGFKFMGWVAYVTVPAFLALCIWAVSVELGKHDVGTLMTEGPVGQPISLAAGATIVAGGFIVGAVMTPDMTRFNRSVGDVVKQTIVGVTLGEYFVGVIGVLLAHALKLQLAEAGGVIAIIQTSTGTIGVIVLILSILKINDWNLYPSTLGVTNAFQTLFGMRVNRVNVTLILGAAGTLLSIFHITTKFMDFLMLLGVVFPPIAGIMIVDYFILKTWRKELDESRAKGELPKQADNFVLGGIIAWVAGALVGHYTGLKDVNIGIPAINSLAATMIVYYALGVAGLARSSKPAAAETPEKAAL